jgi:hypothetical protein
VLSSKLARGFGGFVTVCLVAAGCGGGETDGPDVTESPDIALGGFLIDLVPAMGTTAPFTSVLGKVYDGATPSPIVWTLEEEGSGCQLLVPHVPFCDPRCGGAEVCAAESRCVAYPTAQELGAVRMKGVGTVEVPMAAIGGTYQPPTSAALPYPPLAEGATVQISASGGALGSFTVQSKGIAPIVSSGAVPLRAGAPLALTWTRPAQPDLSRIEVKLDISHHGGTKGKVECNVPDTGALDIPASQISKLVALGVAGFPTVTVTRVASGTTGVKAGRVSLRVSSGVERAVEIPDVQSCTDDSQCPAGKTCQTDLRCQ